MNSTNRRMNGIRPVSSLRFHRGQVLRVRIVSVKDDQGKFLPANGYRVGDDVIVGTNALMPTIIRKGHIMRHNKPLPANLSVKVLSCEGGLRL